MSRPSTGQPGSAPVAFEAPSIAARLTSLERVMGVVDSRVDADQLRSARDVTRQITERLSLSPAHTVVALAGATGSGKSSIFNALAGLDLSEVGVRRPVTNAPHACVWGRDGAGPLLDWLSIPYDNRTGRESALDAESQAELRGLVLLDLPDHDSTQLAHRLEVDRLVELVDLLVWVLDPQKYADEAIHARYLRRLSRHAGVTLVVLNQADTLSSAELDACLADVRRLLDADGLRGVPLVPLSALRGDGMAELRNRITTTVGSRQAAVSRLAADLDDVGAELAPLAGPEVREAVDRGAAKQLYTTLADAAGASAVGEAVERGYKYTASRSLGWPLIGWFGRTKADPLAPLRGNTPRGKGRGRTTARPAVLHPVQRPAVEESLRHLADEAAGGLPAPWPSLVHRASRSEIDQLPDALDRAVATADLGLARRPTWWWGYRAVQYLLVLAFLGGLAWTLGLAIAAAVGGADSALEVGDLVLPLALLVGGLILGPALHVVGMVVARRGARQARLRAEQAVLDAVTTVARERVLGPVRAELSAYAQVRDALVDFGIAVPGGSAAAPEPGTPALGTGTAPITEPALSTRPRTSAGPALPGPAQSAESVRSGQSVGSARSGGSAPPPGPSASALSAASAGAEGNDESDGLGPIPSAARYPDPFQRTTPSAGAPDQGETRAADAQPGPAPLPVRPSTLRSQPTAATAPRSAGESTPHPTTSGGALPETGQSMTAPSTPGRPEFGRPAPERPAPEGPDAPPNRRQAESPNPDAAQPRTDRQVPGRPGQGRPGQPTSGQPGPGQTNARQPGSGQAGASQPHAGQPGPGWPGNVPPPPRPDAVRHGAVPPAPALPPTAPGVRPFLGPITPSPRAASSPVSSPFASAPSAPASPAADASPTSPAAAPVSSAYAGSSNARPGPAGDQDAPTRPPLGRRTGAKLPPAPPPRPAVEADPEVVWARTRPARAEASAGEAAADSGPRGARLDTRRSVGPGGATSDTGKADVPGRASAQSSEPGADESSEQPQRKGIRGLFNRRKESADVVDRWWATTDDGDDPFGRPSAPEPTDDSRKRIPGQR